MYYVDMTVDAKKELRLYFDEAMLQGRGAEYIESLNAIRVRLATDPVEFGEPNYRLPLLSIDIRSGAIVPVYVEYGVFTQYKLVVIRRIRLM